MDEKNPSSQGSPHPEGGAISAGQHRNLPLGLERPVLPAADESSESVIEYGFEHFRSGETVSKELCEEFNRRLPVYFGKPAPAERPLFYLKVIQINLDRAKTDKTEEAKKIIQEYLKLTKESKFDRNSNVGKTYHFLSYMGAGGVPKYLNNIYIGSYNHKKVYTLDFLRYQYYGFLAHNSDSMQQVLNVGNPYTEMVYIGENREIPHRLMFDFDYMLPRLIVKRSYERYEDEADKVVDSEGEELTTGFPAFLVQLLDRYLNVVFDLRDVHYEIRAATTKARVVTKQGGKGFKLGLRLTTNLFMTQSDRMKLYRSFATVVQKWYADEKLNPLLQSEHYTPYEMPPLTNFSASPDGGYVGPKAEGPLDLLQCQGNFFKMRNIFTVKLKIGKASNDPRLRELKDRKKVEIPPKDTNNIPLLKGGVPVPVVSGRSTGDGQPFRFTDTESIKFNFLCERGKFYNAPLPGSDADREPDEKERKRLCRNVVYENYVAFAPMTLPLYELRKNVTVEGFDLNNMNLPDGHLVTWNKKTVTTRVRSHFQNNGNESDVEGILEAFEEIDEKESGSEKSKDKKDGFTETCLGPLKNRDQKEQIKEMLLQGYIPFEVIEVFRKFRKSCIEISHRIEQRIVLKLDALCYNPNSLRKGSQCEKVLLQLFPYMRRRPGSARESVEERRKRMRRFRKQYLKCDRFERTLMAGHHLFKCLNGGEHSKRSRIIEGRWRYFNELGITDISVADKDNDEHKWFLESERGRMQLLMTFMLVNGKHKEGALGSFTRAAEWDPVLHDEFRSGVRKFLDEEVQVYKLTNKRKKKEERQIRFKSRYCVCKKDNHSEAKVTYSLKVVKSSEVFLWKAVVLSAVCFSTKCKNGYVVLVSKSNILYLLRLFDDIPEKTKTLLGVGDWKYSDEMPRRIIAPQPKNAPQGEMNCPLKLELEFHEKGLSSLIVPKERIAGHTQELVDYAFEFAKY